MKLVSVLGIRGVRDKPRDRYGSTAYSFFFGRSNSGKAVNERARINVVITAHAKMRKFEQQDEMGAFDRWKMKLSKQSAPLLKEWCDHLPTPTRRTSADILAEGRSFTTCFPRVRTLTAAILCRRSSSTKS